MSFEMCDVIGCPMYRKCHLVIYHTGVMASLHMLIPTHAMTNAHVTFNTNNLKIFDFMLSTRYCETDF